MASTLERWTGAAWSSESNLIRFTLSDELFRPEFLNATIGDPLNTIQSNYGDYTQVRILEDTTSRVIFYGKIVMTEPDFDGAYGQVIVITARDNLQELLRRLNDTDYTGNTERSALVSSIISDHIFSTNVGTADTDKFTTSLVTEAANVLDSNFNGSGKNALRSIYEIAQEDPMDTNRDNIGYVFYLDHEFNGNSPTPDLHYFPRGARPTSGASTHGLTVELGGAEGNLTRSMLHDYDFPNSAKEIITRVVLKYVDSDGGAAKRTMILINHGAITGGSFAVGETITWAGGGTADIDLVGGSGTDRWLVISESSAGSTAFLNSISGLVIDNGSGQTATVNASTASPPGSIRETIVQDVEVVLRDYSIEQLVEAQERAGQMLFQGGDTITRGNFQIIKWPFYTFTGTHTGAGNAATLTDATGDFLNRGIRAGDIVDNTTDGSSATITTVTATTLVGTLAGGTDNDWDAADAWRVRVIVRVGHAIRVVNSNLSIDADMLVTKIVYDEGPGIAHAKISVLGNTTSRGQGPPTNPIAAILNDNETGMWETPGAIGGLPLATMLVNVSNAFTIVDDDDISWGAGTATFSDGTTLALNANSATLAALTYFYITAGNSEIQTSTTFGNATGTNNALIAIGQNNADTSEDALFVSLNSGSPQLVEGTLIANQLSAITADMGLLTAGEIRVGSGAFPGSFTGFTMNTTRFAGYNSGTVMVEIAAADGKFTGGAGGVVIDDSGIHLLNHVATALIQFERTGFDDIHFNHAGTSFGIVPVAGAIGCHTLVIGDSTPTSELYAINWSTANPNLTFDPGGAGTGRWQIGGVTGINLIPWDTAAGNTMEIRWRELQANGSNHVGFKAPDAIAGDVIWTLPDADGSASGEILQTDAAGTLSWSDHFLPANAIVIWHGTIASIPTGFFICDGNNGTPNLLARFLQGVATAATNPGTTGGSATHTHATHSTHIDHPIGGTADDSGTATVGYPFQNNHAAKSHDAHDAHDTPNSEPPYYDVAFIMKS